MSPRQEERTQALRSQRTTATRDCAVGIEEGRTELAAVGWSTTLCFNEFFSPLLPDPFILYVYICVCLFVFALMINCTSKTDCFCFHGNTRRGREWDFFPTLSVCPQGAATRCCNRAAKWIFFFLNFKCVWKCGSVLLLWFCLILSFTRPLLSQFPTVHKK